MITKRTGGLHADLATLVASRHAKGDERIALQSRLLSAVEDLHAGTPSILHYRHLPRFDLSRLEPSRFDLVVTVCSDAHESCPTLPGRFVSGALQ